MFADAHISSLGYLSTNYQIYLNRPFAIVSHVMNFL